MATIDISNLAACTEDARQAGLDQDPGPADPMQFHTLAGRLQAVRTKMPRLYADAAFNPYFAELLQLGEHQFNQILLQDPAHVRVAGLMLDIAQAILQFGEGFEPRARGAFQQVAADLYDGFLSAEDRRGVLPPDHETLAPLIKFGNPDSGPYTWPVDATSSFGLKTGVVNLPPANIRRGLMAWPALGHETCGHDVLHADDGLLAQVADAVRSALAANASTKSLAEYWAERIDETASDVLGILNMGPAPGIGLIAFFRGLNAAFTGQATLRNDGPNNDPHPADIVRGYLAASTVRSLEFSDAALWANVIETETNRNVTTIRLAGKTVALAVAKQSAELVAQAIAHTPFPALENHAFAEIQNWRDHDENIVTAVRPLLSVAGSSSQKLPDGTFAAHVVAAATTAALQKNADIAVIFSRMLDLLKSMYDKNPVFGPLKIRHAGNITRDLTYLP